MLLSRLNFERMRDKIEGEKPLIVTKNTPRKAVFQKLNLYGFSQKKIPRPRRNEWTRRGNSFAGNRSGQRVVVKINPVKNKTKGVGSGAGSGGKNLQQHIRYISRGGAGKDGEKAVLFDRETEGLDGKDFFHFSKDDRHHFRMIVSPENGHEIEDFQGYVRTVMIHVERDLGTRLEWVSAVHYDTDDVHAHVIVRGKNDRGEDLVIGRDYIAVGIRGRAQEVATDILGERSLDDIQKSMEREVDALRVTSLDRFIEKQKKEENTVDVRKANNFGRDTHYEGLIKGRLRYLATSGLAIETPPGVYTLKKEYQDILRQISERNDVIKRLYGRNLGNLADLSIYSIKAGEGRVIEGRVLDKGFVDEITDRKYLVVQDMGAGKHYIPVGDTGRYEQLEEGALVRVRPGYKSTGKADYNINLIARENGGVYDPELHKQYIEKEQGYIKEEDRKAYMDAHVKRLETLEQNDIVIALPGGRYEVPEDVVARGEEVTRKINKREKKRFYPMVDILSVRPVEGMVQASKKTWLDKELYKQSLGKQGLETYDEGLQKALEQRKDWLIRKDLAFIQSNGAFALRDGAMTGLNKLEIHEAGRKLAEKAGGRFNDRRVQEGEGYVYIGHVELETGTWAVVTKGRDLQMAHIDMKPEFKRGENVRFKALEGSKFEMQAAQMRLQEQGREHAAGAKDKDQEREL